MNALLVASLVAATVPVSPGATAESSAVMTVPLPGGPPVGMDYLALDAAHGRLWVPAGNTGKVDVIDLQTREVTAIDGLPTAASPRADRPRIGPSSASVGGDTVWIGNRADHQVCGFDAVTLKKQPCVKVPAMPDGVQYVPLTHELWITTPATRNLTVASTTEARVVSIALPGAPEGYALDAERGVFYTNLEDQDRTLAIDVRTHAILYSWATGCGSEGPRGLALDGPRHLIFVACTDGVVALDGARAGALVQKITTGKGVDNIDYLPGRRLLFIASREDGKLTTVHVENDGKMSIVASASTAKGARNAVVGADGTAYVADSAGGAILVVPAPR